MYRVILETHLLRRIAHKSFIANAHKRLQSDFMILRKKGHFFKHTHTRRQTSKRSQTGRQSCEKYTRRKKNNKRTVT